MSGSQTQGYSPFPSQFQSAASAALLDPAAVGPGAPASTGAPPLAHDDGHVPGKPKAPAPS